MVEEKTEAAEASWSIFGLLKKMVGILFMISIIKMIVFPAAPPQTEADLISEAEKNI